MTLRVSILSVCLVLSAVANDWSTYRHDPDRSGYTPEKLANDLHLQWSFQVQHAPVPVPFAPTHFHGRVYATSDDGRLAVNYKQVFMPTGHGVHIRGKFLKDHVPTDW